jgi:molecular chaperone DnaK
MDTVIQITSAAVNVDDAAVEAMVSESIEHAFTDMAERVFTEAKMKAEELLPAVDAVLSQGLALDAERGEIESAAAAVRAALAGEAANPLKSAVQRLDAATEALAARLVEQAMDSALDRKLSGE